MCYKQGGRYNCIGSVNFVFLGNNTIERGIFIHPYYRGKGLSKIISLELYEYLHKNRDINIVKTKVLKDNKASLALQLSLGAVLEASDERYNYFMLDLTTT